MPRKRQITGAVLLAILATLAASVQTTVGEISGRMTDSQWFALPGARVTVSLGDDRWEAITDREGRFAVSKLVLATYRVSVEIPGFTTRSGTLTLTPTNPRAHVEWRLEVACLAVADEVRFSVREAARMVDAIVHVRIESDNGSILWSQRPDCDGSTIRDYTAQVLNAVPKPGSALGGLANLRLALPPRDVRLEPGSEYLVLLWQMTPGSAFWRPGDGLVLPVRSGRVAASAGDSLAGMAVSDALETLGRWSRERD